MGSSVKLKKSHKIQIINNITITQHTDKSDVWETPFLIQENVFLIGKR